MLFVFYIIIKKTIQISINQRTVYKEFLLLKDFIHYVIIQQKLIL